MIAAAHKPLNRPQQFKMREMKDIYTAITNEPKSFRSQKEAVDSIREAVKRTLESPSAHAVAARPGRRPEYADHDVVSSVVEENPKKQGSAAHDRFALYRKDMTVGEYIAAGGIRADLVWDVEHKFITIRRR